jgi:Na+-driven multidrug efflux pump
LGAAASSAIGVGIRQIEFVAFTHFLGFNAAASTIVGQCIGAGNVERAGKGGLTAAMGGGLVGFTAMCIFALFPDQLADLLVSDVKDPMVLANTKTYVFLVALSQLPLGIDIALIGTFIGAGRTVLPLLMNVVALSARVVAVVLIVQVGFGIPVEHRFAAVCWAITGSSILKGSLMILAFKMGWWRPLPGDVPAPAPTPVPVSLPVRT